MALGYACINMQLSYPQQHGGKEKGVKRYGIGKYAKDSWEIFQRNNLNVQPNDKVLNLYLATALEQQTQMGRS